MNDPTNPWAADLQPRPTEPDNSSPPFFKAWLVFFLLATFLGMGVGMVAGFVLGAVLGAGGVPIGQIQLYCGIAGYVLALPISFICYRWSVKKYLLQQSVRHAQNG